MQAKFYRVDTTASTRPMLPGETEPEFPAEEESEESEEEGEGGMVMQDRTEFRLEVVE